MTRLVLMTTLAHLNHRKQEKEKAVKKGLIKNMIKNKNVPRTSVIFPIYNEEPEVLEKVMRFAKECLEVPNLEIIFVDDGSPNVEDLKLIYTKYSKSKRIKVVYKENGGKREAQYVGFNHATGKYIITVDSDTIIYPQGIYNLIFAIMKNSKVGAVTGDVRVENDQETWLTKLISIRYWIAFNLERAAQGYTGSMMCCSGPFSIYRGDFIKEIKEDYINQYFLGQKCTYGDDRHLTNLAFSKGLQTKFQEDAIAHTYVPTKMRQYIPQQTRWSKSFFREMIWTLKYFRNISFYSLFDGTAQIILYFLFAINLSYIAYTFITDFNYLVLIYHGILSLFVGTVYAYYGALRKKDWRFFYFIFYSFIHLSVLVPLRLKALLTLKDTDWGTRKKKKRVFPDFFKWFAIYFGLVFATGFSIDYLQKNNINWQFTDIVNFFNEPRILYALSLIPISVGMVIMIEQAVKFVKSNLKLKDFKLAFGIAYTGLLIIVSVLGDIN